jgi:hypothetical protein
VSGLGWQSGEAARLTDHDRHGRHGDTDGDAVSVITAVTAPAVAHAPRGA